MYFHLSTLYKVGRYYGKTDSKILNINTKPRNGGVKLVEFVVARYYIYFI